MVRMKLSTTVSKCSLIAGVLETPKFVGKAVVSLSGAITYKVDQEEVIGR
jgi:hypothetical protein